MSEVARHSPRRPTQAAEGLPRWRWTLDEFERFVELGVLSEDDRVELIGGELVPMAAKGIRHENVKSMQMDWLYRRLPESAQLSAELGWRPDGETYCEPDIVVFRRGTPSVSKVPSSDVLLLIEVADTTMKYDSETKARLYAGLGVAEYWIVDAQKLTTRVHLEPSSSGYAVRRDEWPETRLVPSLVPELAVRLADLRL